MNNLVRIIDLFTGFCGRVLAWLSVGMMLVTCVVVLMRYVFAAGNIIFFQELVVYMHASAFMLGAAWALKRQGHVRVDVFYRRFSRSRRAWVDSVGTLVFLMPFAVFLFLSSEEFVSQSWRVRETSAEAGGIPGVYLLKTLIPVMAGLLFLQGIAELLRNAIVLSRGEQDGD